MKASMSFCFVFVVFIIILVFGSVQSMMRSSPERKLIVPSRAAYDRQDKTPKKQIDRAQGSRTLSRHESMEANQRPVNSPSERLRKLQIPSRSSSSSFERLDRDYLRSTSRTKRNLPPSQYKSPFLEPSFSRLNLSDRVNRRTPNEQELIDMRALLKPPPPDTPPEVKVKLRHGSVTIFRETEVDSVHHPVPDDNICTLDEKDIASVCDTCSKVYEKVYKRKKYRPLATPLKRNKTCSQRMALFGITWVEVNVRKCPFSPDFYLSQGNGDGWVFVFTPIKGSEDLRFQVHLGEFDEVLPTKRTRVGWSYFRV